MFNIWSWCLSIVYKTKHRGSLVHLAKLTEVMMSCLTAGHCETAERYLQLYTDKYISSAQEDGYTRTSNAVMKQFKLYLKDTREHALLGMHYPKWNGKYNRKEF